VCVVLGLIQINTCSKVPLFVIFLDDDICIAFYDPYLSTPGGIHGFYQHFIFRSNSVPPHRGRGQIRILDPGPDSHVQNTAFKKKTYLIKPFIFV
jgi:hypothetical protein